MNVQRLKALVAVGLLAPALLFSGCGTADPAEQRAALIERAQAPLFDGMGDYHRAITTADEGAQTYFDQGMVIAFGFNHAESIRSFRAAQRLDEDCAMCFWGEALATGPNINVTSNGKAIMSEDDRHAAFAAVQKAQALAADTTAVEQGLIEALAARYNGDPETPREPLDIAYADAMRELAQAHPQDNDVQALFAEALMTTMPWDYWLDENNPKPGTVEVLAALEGVMERDPDHPLALHLYIHAVEASSTPDRAEPAADHLSNLVPGSGHLVHMPAHIYWRVGRYDDAANSNIRAAAVDEAYIAQCNAQGFYPALYYPHNIHFLWAASTMQGNSALSIESARKVADNVQLAQIEQFPTIEFFKTIPLLSLVRFNRWDGIMSEPQPPENLEFSTAIWHYARGVALANTGDLAGAKAEQANIPPLAERASINFLDTNDYPASALLSIANHLLLGEIAWKEGKTSEAIPHFAAAVVGQDELPYTEPPFWYYPTRQSLGAVLLDAGRAADAEAVFRKDLEQYPHNGWSLFGLIQSLEAQGKDPGDLREKFERMWGKADVELTNAVTV